MKQEEQQLVSNWLLQRTFNKDCLNKQQLSAAAL